MRPDQLRGIHALMEECNPLQRQRVIDLACMALAEEGTGDGVCPPGRPPWTTTARRLDVHTHIHSHVHEDGTEHEHGHDHVHDGEAEHDAPGQTNAFSNSGGDHAPHEHVHNHLGMGSHPHPHVHGHESRTHLAAHRGENLLRAAGPAMTRANWRT